MAALSSGIMGGTFDPVHRGHVELAKCAQRQLSLGEVVWIPAGEPWRKAGREITAAEHRLAMVRLVTRREAGWQTSTIELDREGPTYAVDTAETLHHERKDEGLVLILGQDALRDLPNWHEPERLIQLVELAVAPRGERVENPTELEELLPGLSRRVTWLDLPPVPVSATLVRELAAQGKPLSELLPARVEEYIREHNLYVA